MLSESAIGNVGLSKAGKPVLDRETIRGGIKGKVTLDGNNIAANLTDLSFASASNLFSINKTPDAPIDVKMAGGGIAGNGALGVFSVRFSVPPRAERWLSLPIGAVTGFLGAATGVFVIPSVPYLQAVGLNKDDLIQALAISPWLLLPAVPVIVVILALNFRGDGLRDAADPYGH